MINTVRKIVYNKAPHISDAEFAIESFIENYHTFMNLRLKDLEKLRCMDCHKNISLTDHGKVWANDSRGYDTQFYRTEVRCDCCKGYSDIPIDISSDGELVEKLRTLDCHRVASTASHWK